MIAGESGTYASGGTRVRGVVALLLGTAVTVSGCGPRHFAALTAAAALSDVVHQYPRLFGAGMFLRHEGEAECDIHENGPFSNQLVIRATCTTEVVAHGTGWGGLLIQTYMLNGSGHPMMTRFNVGASGKVSPPVTTGAPPPLIK